MADLNKTVILTSYPSMTPNATIIPFLYECAAAAQNDVIFLANVERGVTVYGMNHVRDALGANNGLTFRLINQATGATLATLLTIADASAAGAAGEDTTYFPYKTAADAFLVAVKTGAGTATGTLQGWLTTVNGGVE